ncbi:hypothetical protein QTP81_02140 [Alteromonas sp. ASW11-36]|uniref:Uncharacterized protein n=1 Tax=Alteromonas arenosi TaxID=3055817 RepID=A0ABT7ST83_9ALTE|nr:hypothetical protein [Alteromonas sp. ASW11-36]MDM7859404.1 hypothetical protein [Alteromonas sp. ASW11-36]
MTAVDGRKSESVIEKISLFGELFTFVKESTGIAITCAYIMLLLTSMGYIYFLYAEFDIQIIKYVTFEDILATPIKNPNIIFTFSCLLLLLYLTDVGANFRAKQFAKYPNGKRPFYISLLMQILWTPKDQQLNRRIATVTIGLSLVAYTFFFAKIEATDLKEEREEMVEIVLVDSEEPLQVLLIGTSLNYVFAYDFTTQKSMVYYVESIQSITNLTLELDEPDDAPTESIEQTSESTSSA